PSGPSEPYAFVGTWDCGVETFTFTNMTYNDGTNTFPIRSVARDGMNYTLRFGNNYILALGAVTETVMAVGSTRAARSVRIAPHRRRAGDSDRLRSRAAGCGWRGAGRTG
ncbi:MAG: hypothetical protein HC889_18040, partial [Synechococcaceae cyanobacterium SM1_2_3]|nr:hypothetical protein [Synechococcaceae cyanobacterium SM1_2_3]